MKHDFPRVSRSRLFDVDRNSADVGDGKTAAPTEEERAWLDIMKSTDPERDRLRKKLSVCAFADVTEYNRESVSFMYDGITYTIRKPVNGFRVARAREYSKMEALEELNAQRQIVKGAVPIEKDFSGIDAEVINIMASVAENFFFTPYL